MNPILKSYDRSITLEFSIPPDASDKSKQNFALMILQTQRFIDQYQPSELSLKKIHKQNTNNHKYITNILILPIMLILGGLAVSAILIGLGVGLYY